MSNPALRITLAGIPSFKSALNDAYATRAMNALRSGLYAAGQAVATHSKRLAPKDTGVLRGSIFATLPVAVSKTRVQMDVGAGGPAQKYALAQHEGTNGIVVFRRYTTSGTGPKYIDRAIAAVRSNPAIFARAAKAAWAAGAQIATHGGIPHTPNEGPQHPTSGRARRRRTPSRGRK